MRMKVTINGKVSKEVLTSILNEQKDKTKLIDSFAKENKVESIFYKDAELEYEGGFTKAPSKRIEVEKRWVNKKKLDLQRLN